MPTFATAWRRTARPGKRASGPCCGARWTRSNNEFGLRLVAAFEQEFYLVEGLERPGPNYSIIAHERALGFGAVLVAALRAAGLEPETFEPEGGPGQYEVNCRPALGLAAADRALLVRELVRAVATREGYQARPSHR